MAKSAVAISVDFRKRLNSLEYTRKKASTLFIDNRITRRDVEQIYQGLFLEATAAFESLIEDLFLGLLTKRIILNSSRTSPKIFFTSRAIAIPIIFNGPYFNWLPYENTQQRAKDFFKDGHPFTVLSQSDLNQIKNFLLIRNAIAHKSTHAKRKFEDRVIGPTPLSPRERRVGAYLAGNFRSSPSQTRYENLILDMASIFEKLCVA